MFIYLNLQEDSLVENVSEGTAEDSAKYAAFSSTGIKGPLGQLLRDLDFRDIVDEKCGQYMQGTRRWLFDDFRAWNRKAIHPTDSKRKLFWLMGAGGTGKSVISAELLRRGLVSSEELGCSFLAWYSLFLLLFFLFVIL